MRYQVLLVHVAIRPYVHGIVVQVEPYRRTFPTSECTTYRYRYQGLLIAPSTLRGDTVLDLLPTRPTYRYYLPQYTTPS